MLRDKYAAEFAAYDPIAVLATPAGFAARPAGSLRAVGELEISTIGGFKRLRLNNEATMKRWSCFSAYGELRSRSTKPCGLCSRITTKDTLEIP